MYDNIQYMGLKHQCLDAPSEYMVPGEHPVDIRPASAPFDSVAVVNSGKKTLAFGGDSIKTIKETRKDGSISTITEFSEKSHKTVVVAGFAGKSEWGAGLGFRIEYPKGNPPKIVEMSETELLTLYSSQYSSPGKEEIYEQLTVDVPSKEDLPVLLEEGVCGDVICEPLKKVMEEEIVAPIATGETVVGFSKYTPNGRKCFVQKIWPDTSEDMVKCVFPNDDPTEGAIGVFYNKKGEPVGFLNKQQLFAEFQEQSYAFPARHSQLGDNGDYY